jgi:hypothetical protein
MMKVAVQQPYQSRRIIPHLLPIHKNNGEFWNSETQKTMSSQGEEGG